MQIGRIVQPLLFVRLLIPSIKHGLLNIKIH